MKNKIIKSVAYACGIVWLISVTLLESASILPLVTLVFSMAVLIALGYANNIIK